MTDFIPQSGQAMQRIDLHLDDEGLNWDQARDAALAIASDDDEMTMLISWFDRARGKFSPSCCKCEIKDTPAWEVYGQNHGGRLRISINDDTYVFIYS